MKLQKAIGKIAIAEERGVWYYKIHLENVYDVIMNISDCQLSPGVQSYLHSMKSENEQDGSPFIIRGLLEERASEIHPFQWADMRWWISQGGRGAWFWDMRLGKTIASLLVIEWLNENIDNFPPSIIITPNNGKYVYKAEEEDWLKPPHNRVLVLEGSSKQKSEQLRSVKSGAVVVNWDAIRLLKEQILSRTWGVAVIDESHYSKNPNAKRSQVMQGIKSKHVLALSGTPMPNSPIELWSVLNFINPNFYPDYKTFVRRFAVQELNRIPGGRGRMAYQVSAYKETREIMAALDIMTRRRRFEEELGYRPVVHHINQFVTMSDGQNQLYKAVLDDTIQEHQTRIRKINPLTQVMRLRQIASHPCLIGSESESAKMDYFPWLLDNVDAPVVAFSQFPETVRRLAESLGDQAVLVTSDMNTMEREKARQEFQNGKGRIFCTTIGICKEAVKLDRADVVVFIDSTWVPSDMMQATRRTWGQRKDRPMSVIKLIAHGTIEEYVEKRLGEKQLLSDVLIDRDFSKLDSSAREQLDSVVSDYLFEINASGGV